MQSPQIQMALQGTLQNLQSLTIHQPIYYDNPPSQRDVSNIKLFLAATQTVEELDLNLIALAPSPGAEGYHPVVTVFLDQTWSKLHRLAVRGLCCTEGQLVSFLDGHSSTLDHLTFYHLTLVSLATPLASPSSLIRIIWKLGQLPRLHLRQCLFEDSVRIWRLLLEATRTQAYSSSFRSTSAKGDPSHMQITGKRCSQDLLIRTIRHLPRCAQKNASWLDGTPRMSGFAHHRPSRRLSMRSISLFALCNITCHLTKYRGGLVTCLGMH